MNIYINKVAYNVGEGKNLLEVCLSLGFDIPYFCYHPSLCSVGACRLCAVKKHNNADDIKGRIIMSCMEPVEEGMIITTEDSEIKEFRANVIESLMINHPHDCPICDEGGECHLQDMTVMSGHNYRRYAYKKRTHRNQNLGPFINHEMNRCIQCYRCVRYYKNYAGGKDLNVYGSRNNLYFGRHENGKLESEFSGNLIEVCPTGVFTDKTLKKHYTRKWDLTSSPSICPHCSLGCNIFVSERYGTLRRVMNRYNSEVNGYFICDRGRFGYEFANSKKRVNNILFRNNKTEEYEIINRERLLEILNPIFTKADKKQFIGIGSSKASLESNYALQKLVGKENFYSGSSIQDYKLIKQIHDIYNSTSAKIPSLKEIEKADALLILGEDLTNTAPIAALSVRQSVRNKPLENAELNKIPRWHDQAVRNFIGEDKGALFIATPFATKLDDIATETYRAATDDIARFGYAIANILNTSSPVVEGLNEELLQRAETIAKALKEAKNPVIISGSFSNSIDIVKSASNIANALCLLKENKAGLFYVLPEANSLGLMMLGANPISHLLEDSNFNTEEKINAIILEKDVYKEGNNDKIVEFFSKCEHIISLCVIENSTTLRSDIIIPVASNYEGDGTYINNEGRAQRFYSTLPDNSQLNGGISKLESWKWLLHFININEVKEDSRLKLDLLTEEISYSNPIFDELKKTLPHEASGSIDTAIPRQTQRYTGRTAMYSNVNISEQKPPKDFDSPLSFTMEGSQKDIPSSDIAFYWWQGWNSVQALNKYQREIGGLMKNENTNIKLIGHESKAPVVNFTEIPNEFKNKKDKFLILEHTNIFGSESLSSLSPSIIEASPESYILLNDKDAKRIEIENNESVNVIIKNNIYTAITKTGEDIPEGLAGLYLRYNEYGRIDLPEFGKIIKTVK